MTRENIDTEINSSPLGGIPLSDPENPRKLKVFQGVQEIGNLPDVYGWHPGWVVASPWF